MTSEVPRFRANRILAALSAAECRRMASHLTPVAMPLGRLLNEAGDAQRWAYFPLDCMVSHVATVEERLSTEVGLVGREGMVGVTLALGVRESPARAIVQCAGSAIRIPAVAFAKLVNRNSALRAAVHRYAYTSLSMAMLIAACNQAHRLEARLARWLLMTRDCISTNTFEITQEFLGQMLGVRRPSVNAVATVLQRRGLISYRRGVVKLLDIPGLQATSCSCYPKVLTLTMGGT